MKVTLLTSDSPAQRALAHRIHDEPELDLAGIVVQEVLGTRRWDWIRDTGLRHPTRLLSKVLQRTVLARPLGEILAAEAERFGHDRPWPPVPLVEVTDVNGAEAVAFVQSTAADVIAVSGTKIVRAPIFAVAPARGLLNLHTGISPYVKGGPNCTLWCLAKGEPQLIGATIHVLDPGIDSGPIVTTAQLDIAGDETPGQLVAGTTALGHDLYVAALRELARHGTLRSVPQATLGEGTTYFTRQWNVVELGRALRFVRGGRLRRWVADGRPAPEPPRLVELAAG
jgi:hypothetical protein